MVYLLPSIVLFN